MGWRGRFFGNSHSCLNIRLKGLLFPFLGLLSLFFFYQDVSLVNPNFDADGSIRRESFRKTVINIRAKSSERNLALFISISSRDFRAAQASGTQNLDPERAFLHGQLHGFFHGFPE